jgi:hypothetical protein
VRQTTFLPILLVLLASSSFAVGAPPDTARTVPSDAITTPPLPFSLETLVQRVNTALPAHWKVVESAVGESPIGWDGPDEGLYVMVEDTRTRFFHPNGFHYFSFYRIWIMPSGWEGEMRRTPYVTDSTPAFLLGVDERFVAFYHTAGGNVWTEGPRSFCRALGIDDLCHTSISHRVIDLECEERLMAHGADDATVKRDRIIGLTGGDTALYLEYVFPVEQGPPDRGLGELTDRIALDVFAAFPEIESVYLRRCTSDTFTDTIIAR